MAKASTSKLTKEERIIKSLSTASKTLNKIIHKPADIVAADGVGAPLVRLFQVFCPDENRVISAPTTDEDAAREFRDDHNLTSGHNSKVLVSNN
jgi:hypothetical protein